MAYSSILKCFLLAILAATEALAVNVTLTPRFGYVSAESSTSMVSFNLDWHPANEGTAWANSSVVHLDLTSKRVRALAKALAPAYLRIGGSEGDIATYLVDPSQPPSSCEPDFCLTMPRWRELTQFCQDTGLNLVFGLNICEGRDAGCKGPYWNSTNVYQLLKYTADNNLTVHGFELGNEKEHVMAPEDAATAFKQTRAWIDQLWPDAAIRPILVGPDLNPRADWLRAFLQAGGADAVDAVTYHLYIGYGLSADLQDKLTQPSTMDFIHWISQPIQRAQQAEAPGTDLWVGESAAAWHSGKAGVCDSFISGFWYINELGMLAATGHKALCRQAFIGGSYSLVDQTNGFKPNPDYWTGLLYHRLMGDKFLDTPQLEPAKADLIAELKAYAACTNGATNGSVTWAYSNFFANQTVWLDIHVDRLDPSQPASVGEHVDVYILTADSLLSRDVKLNNVTLAMVDETSLPDLQPVAMNVNEILLPPFSYGFMVAPDAKAEACMS